MKRKYPVIDGVVVSKIGRLVYCECSELWDRDRYNCVGKDINTLCDNCGFYVWTHERKKK
jgi:hypothetical protein